MTRTVTTTRAAAVPTIPATIGPAEGPIGPLGNPWGKPWAFAGTARAPLRATIRTPQHAYFEIMLTPYMCECISCRQLHQPREQRDPKARVRRATGFADWPRSTMLPKAQLCHALAPGLFADKVARQDCCPLHPDSMLAPRSPETAWTKRRYSQPRQNPHRWDLVARGTPVRLNPSRQSTARKYLPDLHAIHRLATPGYSRRRTQDEC